MEDASEDMNFSTYRHPLACPVNTYAACCTFKLVSEFSRITDGMYVMWISIHVQIDIQLVKYTYVPLTGPHTQHNF